MRRLHHTRGAQECGGEARRHLLTGDSGTYCSRAVHLLFCCSHAHEHDHAVHILRTYRAYIVLMRCTYLLAGDGEVRYGGIRAVRGGRVRVVRQGVEVQVGQPVHVHRMHVRWTRAAYPPSVARVDVVALHLHMQRAGAPDAAQVARGRHEWHEAHAAERRAVSHAISPHGNDTSRRVVGS